MYLAYQLVQRMLVASIFINSIFLTMPKVHAPLLQTTNSSSVSPTVLSLEESSTSLMIVSENQPCHYCTSIANQSSALTSYDPYLSVCQTISYRNGDISDFKDIFSILEDTGNLQSIYLEVDPYRIDLEELSVFTDFLQSHKELRITFCLPVYSNFVWNTMIEDNTFPKVIESYSCFSAAMLSHEQVTVLFPNMLYFIGAEGNGFDDNEQYTMDMAEFIAESVCNGECTVAAESVQRVFSDFYTVLIEELSKRYPDYSNQNIAIFGDSVNGNFGPLCSISSFMNSLSGANIYNFSIGGASAYSNPNDPNYSCCLLTQINAVISGDLSALQPDCLLYENYKNLPDNRTFDKIILEFGLNDYLNNFPIKNEGNNHASDTTEGAYRIAIETLKTQYPDAVIYLVLPNHVFFFENGTVQVNNQGTLEDYVDSISRIAAEYQLPVIDCYHIPGWSYESHSDYSLDGVHPNALGRFELAKRYLSAL